MPENRTTPTLTMRTDKRTGSHEFVTVFMNGARVGQLCLRLDEVHALYFTLEAGAKHTGLEFKWREEQ